MTVCAKLISTADGMVVALDPTHTDLSTCAYVLEDGSSTAWRELGNLSLENASQISMLVAALWALAFGLRQVRRVLDAADEKE